MSSFKKMVSMQKTDTEKKAEQARYDAPTPFNATDDYPYGLCISLCQADLDKLNLDGDCEAGDTIHLVAFAKVTSISKKQVDGKQDTRIELQITDLAVEDEDNEAAGEV